MKMYIQPNTKTLVLNACDRLCQTDVVSVGSNVDMKYGGESGPGYKPM